MQSAPSLLSVSAHLTLIILPAAFCVNSSSFIFHISCFFACNINVSFLFGRFLLPLQFPLGLKKSLISSSHLFLGLPSGLFVLMSVLRPGFHSDVFLDHRSSGRDTSLIANLHSIFLCVSIQHAAFICSAVSFVLLFM